MLSQGHEVINVDESIIRTTDHRRRGWAQAKNRILVTRALRLPQISMIGAITSAGRVFFTINQGKTTSETFSLFLAKLCSKLDETDPVWRQHSTIVLDNASVHKSKETRTWFQAYGAPVMYLAPYSFKMAAVEKLFSFVKNRDMNPLTIRAYSR
jgi:transposase